MSGKHKTRRTVITLAVVLAIAVLGLTGCFGRDQAVDKGESTVAPIVGSPEAMPPETGVGDEALGGDASAPGRDLTGGVGDDASKVPDKDRLVVRTTGIRLRVDDVDESVRRIRDLTREFGGMVTSLQVSTDDRTPIYDYAATGGLADGTPLFGYVTVRVPADRLDEFTEKVGALGTVLQESAEESDVTQEHIDLKARLENLQAQEARLREFFDAARKVDEMLAIEQELGRVRGEIEAMQAQIAYLERQAAMATVTIQLVRPEPLVRPDEESSGFREAVRDGIAAAADLLQYALTALIATSPIWVTAVVVVAVVFAVRGAVRRRRGTRPADGDTSAGDADR